MDMRHKFSVDFDNRPLPRRVETTRSLLDPDYDWPQSWPDSRADGTRVQTRQHADCRFSERLVTTMADEPDVTEQVGPRFWIGAVVAGTLTAVALVQGLSVSLKVVRGLF